MTLWVNTIGPYHNPQEVYPYYSLPFCRPELGIDIKRYSHTLGELLEGYELRNSGLPLHFNRKILLF